MQPRLRRGQVLGVLAFVDLQAGHAAVGVARQQRPRQLGGAAAEFDDVLPGQRHQGGQDIEFIIDQRRAAGMLGS